ncbi:MAG: chromate transporter [Treponemataceae bacterium]
MNKYKKSNSENLKTALQLFASFFKLGAITFGGGLAMLPLLRREVVQKRGWATDEEMIDYYAIGQSTPGIIATNVATFIGFNLLGFFGSLIATVAIVLPSITVITLIAMLASMESVKNFTILSKALNGVNVAVAVLLFSSLIDLGKKTISDIFTLFIAIGSFVAMNFFSVSAVWIVLISAGLGILIKLTIKKTEEKHNGNN